LYEEIHALNTRKDEFIGFASHELRTPLTTISGYLQLAQKDPEIAKDVLPKMSNQVNRLTAIINDLLDLSKIQAGRLDLNFSKTSLIGLIHENVDTIKQLYPKRNIELELIAEDITVTIDSQKMGQVLINILGNAVKYSPDDTKIQLKVMRLGDQIRVSIQDWGIGIPKEDITKVFSQFYRSHVSRSTTEGMGLGLYISKEIIDGHRGKIWAESGGERGTIFHIDFPIEGKHR
jgi:signal transduction histidine kinase